MSVPKVPLLKLDPHGLYCEAGDFYVDPWRPVKRAIITHAHADHARWGSERYLCAATGAQVLRERVGRTANIQSLTFGETLDINGVKLSLFPAGHILGSAQIRLEHRGDVWVVSGDYKFGEYSIGNREAFEVVKCNTLISECTFGLPIYRWQSTAKILDQINQWWQANMAAGAFSIVGAYALGKAQRIILGLDPAIGPIYCHGAVTRFNEVYRAEGVPLPRTLDATKGNVKLNGPGIVIAPPAAIDSPWQRSFRPERTAFASGWMLIRGSRRRRGVDQGFVLSDHSDWSGLVETVKVTGAENVLLTHGQTAAMERFLAETLGVRASSLHTEFVGETDAEDALSDDENAYTEDPPAVSSEGVDQ